MFDTMHYSGYCCQAPCGQRSEGESSQARVVGLIPPSISIDRHRQEGGAKCTRWFESIPGSVAASSPLPSVRRRRRLWHSVVRAGGAMFLLRMSRICQAWFGPVPQQQSDSHACRPRSPSTPSRAMSGTMTSAARGSAHHQFTNRLSTRPPSSMAER